MDRESIQEWQRVKTDYSLAIDEMWCYGRRKECNPVFAELLEAEKELKTEEEKHFHFEWNIVDIDESHIYVTHNDNGHRYHISVIYPAALYVDVYCVNEDGTEQKVY